MTSWEKSVRSSLFKNRYGKNEFVEKSKNLTRYRSKNKFVGIIKIIM